MDSSKEIEKIELSQNYQAEIFGLGEVYEIMSVERIRKNLQKKFQNGTLYLSSNKNHIQRGMTLQELEKRINEEGFQVSEKGYADSPPWQSAPRNSENRRNYKPILVKISKIIFFFLVRMEFLRESPEHSHMIYCFVKK